MVGFVVDHGFVAIFVSHFLQFPCLTLFVRTCDVLYRYRYQCSNSFSSKPDLITRGAKSFAPPVFNYSYTWNIYILPVPGTVLVWAPNTVSADLVSPPESRESRNQWIRVRQSEYIFKNSEIINYISKNAFILEKMDLYHFHLTNSPYVMTYSDPFATCIPYVMMHLAHIDFATCRIQK